MKSRVWRMAGVGLLCMSVNLPLLAEGQGASPLQSRPDEVRQTQAPRTGYYQDIPRRNDNRYYQAGGAGHPDGHGNGWGPGPQYRPGQTIERFPERFETFEAAIRSLPQVLECSLVTGMDADYQLKVVVPDMDHYQQLLLGHLTRIEGVTSVRSSFVLNQVLASTELPLTHLR